MAVRNYEVRAEAIQSVNQITTITTYVSAHNDRSARKLGKDKFERAEYKKINIKSCKLLRR